MNNYIQRLVSVKKKNNEVVSKRETKAKNPPSETAMPVGGTSFTVPRAKGNRRRINQVTPSSPRKIETTTETETKSNERMDSTKFTSSNKPSPRRVRQYMRSTSRNGHSSVGDASEHSLSGQEISSNDTDSDGNNCEASSRASWMALANGSDSQKNISDNVNYDTVGDEKPNVTIREGSSQSPTPGPIPWDEGREPSQSIASTSIRIMLEEKESVERELTDVMMDRDILRRQLSEARAELDIAKSTLRKNISDLEDQLRNLQQSERRHTELEENALLEEEINELARFAKEQEEKKAATELAVAATLNTRQQNIAETIRDRNDNKDTTAFCDGIIVSTEGWTTSSINPARSSSLCKVKRNTLALPKQEQQSRINSVFEVNDALRDSQLREKILETEIRQLKGQAQVELKKFEESQRQVRWFQQELKVLFPEGDEPSSLLLNTAHQNKIRKKQNRRNHAKDNENNSAHLETIKEDNIDNKDGSEHIIKNIYDSDSDSTKGEIFIDEMFEKSSNFDSSKELTEGPSKQQISDEDFLRNEGAWKGLLDRIQDLEADRKARIELEDALREELKNMSELDKETKNQAVAVEDRVRVLQTYLDASFSVSPKREQQLELEQDYFSTHSKNRGKDESNEDKSGGKSAASAQKIDVVIDSINSDTTQSVKFVEVKSESISPKGDAFFDAKQKSYDLSIDLDRTNSPQSSTRILKSRDTEEQSVNSNVLVHNLHLKLEEEMGNLKKRKELRRSRALSTDWSSNQDIVRYRSLLDSTADFLHLKSRTSDQNFVISDVKTSTPQSEVDTSTKQSFIGCLKADSEQLRMFTEQDRGNDRDEDFEWKEEGRSKGEDGYRGIMEEKHSRLEHALETVNYGKARIEIQLKDAMQQINESVEKVNTLNIEISECCCSLDRSEKEKSELADQLDIIRNEMSELKKNTLENEKDKRLFEETILKLNEDLGAKDKLILEAGKMHRMKMLEMKRSLDEAHKARREDHTSRNQISELEEKVLLIEKESKTSMIVMCEEVDVVIEERRVLESKFSDASKELHEYKLNEPLLRKTYEERIEKLEYAKEVARQLSKTNGKEIIEMKETIDEKNQHILKLENHLSCYDTRLEQASTQLSELENELLNRDKEIEKLDSKHHQIQDKASIQLNDMEQVLEKEGQVINQLEEEKLKLQNTVRNYEYQIEKQVGRLAEASVQLSELEREVFAKEDEIEEMELRINAMQALEAQRYETLQDSELQKKLLEENIESAKLTIQDLTSRLETVEGESERKKTESQRELVEDGRKNSEILSIQNQLNRQLQNVSKLTEQNDKWQLQLEKAHDEKKELCDKLSDAKRERTSLRKELEVSNGKIKELNATNTRLKDDLVCAMEEHAKDVVRIAQMEDQKKVLSQKLESTIESLADLQKRNEVAREIDERLGTSIIDELHANLQ